MADRAVTDSGITMHARKKHQSQYDATMVELEDFSVSSIASHAEIKQGYRNKCI
jgi:hypothetical protein